MRNLYRVVVIASFFARVGKSDVTGTITQLAAKEAVAAALLKTFIVWRD